MNKRSRVLNLLDTTVEPDYVPAAFFLHFDPDHHRGQPAVDRHLEYFRYTDMDFVKIQYENPFPYLPEIQTPADWVKIPVYGEDFFEGPLGVVAELVEAAKSEALVVMTLYSPFMCAGHTVGREQVTEHIKDNPDQVKKGMEVITASLMTFVKACVRLGIDGFYASTQGGESHRFEDPALFAECVKPYDLALWEEMDRSCVFNILHVCDYHGGYDDLTPFFDYPGHVVNCSLKVGTEMLSGEEIARMFGRPYMGGMDRHGVIVSGSPEEIERATRQVLGDAPDRFILGADCTLPSDIDWDNIRTAISTAHGYRAK
ncbi:MAG: hypothetical protein GX620_10050 [Chloroflexi bacterium]|nr:hypothetical protein [Chloroflexota bacterium]